MQPLLITLIWLVVKIIEALTGNLCSKAKLYKEDASTVDGPSDTRIYSTINLFYKISIRFEVVKCSTDK